MIAAVRSEVSVNEPVLYVAFELANKQWKMAMAPGVGVPPWVRTVPARDLAAVGRALRAGRERFQLPADVPVVSCYEAGRDGFWLHRALEGMAVANRVIDSASIEVNRRARRTKTDRLDALKLVTMLVRVGQGERHVWAEVRVPAPEVEAARHLSRERTALRQEQTRVRNQIGSWLATWGCSVSARTRHRREWWTEVCDWADRALPPTVQGRLARAEARLAVSRSSWRRSRRSRRSRRAPARRRVRGRGWCSCAAWRRPARPSCSTRAWSGARLRTVANSAACSASRRRPRRAATAAATKGFAGPAIRGCSR